MLLLDFPIFKSDPLILGCLLVTLAVVFTTSNSSSTFLKKLYTFFPPILLCYFIPALLNWPLGIISPDWFDMDALRQAGYDFPIPNLDYEGMISYLKEKGLSESEIDSYTSQSQLYYVASRYLLPASLILLCISIDFKSILNLGPKALILFFSGTLGIVIGGPIALLFVMKVFPQLINVSPDELWRGLSTIAGSWIGGGANQLAMKEIYEVPDKLFSSMIIVDVAVFNVWMALLLYGTNMTQRIDKWLKSDTSAIIQLQEKASEYRSRVEKIPTTTNLFVLLGVAFGGVALSHLCADLITPLMEQYSQRLVQLGLDSLLSRFFWLVVIATTLGLLLSFTKLKKIEGYGASKWGTVCIYILVTTIGMKMNLLYIFDNIGLLVVGLVWMIIHAGIIITMAKLLKAPFFFAAVGSLANVGGAASAPVIASAFNPSLAPVGVLLAVLGYAVGTYGAILCAELMGWVAG